MQEQSPLLLAPAAKRRCSFKREYPFPIVTKDCEEDEMDPDWKCIKGYLKEDCVLVRDEQGIKLLYSTGFFGKGTHSKNAPQICTKKKETDKNVDQEKQNVPEQSSTNECTDDDEVVEVIGSDDEEPALKKEEISSDVEVVLSDSNSPPPAPANEAHTTVKSQECDEEENLQLTFEEAYFLSYGLGCLVVMDDEQPLNLARLWNKFCELTPDLSFPVMYTAYHHFRSKGWIVKSGVKYGVDYVLYKDGPPFYHATYSVVVKPVKEQLMRDIRGNKRFTWSSLAALNRVNSTAGKGLIFLYVIKPNAMSENKISTPFCISQYKIEEVILKRWVPAENREDIVIDCVD